MIPRSSFSEAYQIFGEQKRKYNEYLNLSERQLRQFSDQKLMEIAISREYTTQLIRSNQLIQKEIDYRKRFQPILDNNLPYSSHQDNEKKTSLLNERNTSNKKFDKMHSKEIITQKYQMIRQQYLDQSNIKEYNFYYEMSQSDHDSDLWQQNLQQFTNQLEHNVMEKLDIEDQEESDSYQTESQYSESDLSFSSIKEEEIENDSEESQILEQQDTNSKPPFIPEIQIPDLQFSFIDQIPFQIENLQISPNQHVQMHCEIQTSSKTPIYQEENTQIMKSQSLDRLSNNAQQSQEGNQSSLQLNSFIEIEKQDVEDLINLNNKLINSQLKLIEPFPLHLFPFQHLQNGINREEFISLRQYIFLLRFYSRKKNFSFI